jgi:hypothetical protein
LGVWKCHYWNDSKLACYFDRSWYVLGDNDKEILLLVLKAHLFYFLPAESIFLDENNLVGQLPNFPSPNLKQLQFQNNTLSGTVPASLWSNTGLLEVRLDANKLIGTIPSTIGNLAGIFDLRVANNALTGTLPAEIARLSTLRKYAGVRNMFIINLELLLAHLMFLYPCITSRILASQ